MLPDHGMRVTHQPVGGWEGREGLLNENDRDSRRLRKVEVAYFSLTWSPA